MIEGFLRAALIAWGAIVRRPLGLCDSSDLDGIVCGALFKMKYPEGVLVLAPPSVVKSSQLVRLVKWEFVADLPCPGRARIRADHHASNKPCADEEFFDPSAPAAAVLAIKALGLEENPLAKRLVELAVESDTARLKTKEAILLSYAVKGADLQGRMFLARELARRGLKLLEDPRVLSWARRFEERIRRTNQLLERLPVREEAIIVFERDLGLAYRHLCIELERKGAKLTYVLVPKGLFTVRLYAGARLDGPFDASKLAKRLGGGGHRYSAGATIKAIPRARALKAAIKVVAEEIGVDARATIVRGDGSLSEVRLGELL